MTSFSAPSASEETVPQSPRRSRQGSVSGNRHQRSPYSTHLGIHLLDEKSRIIYVSSGIRQCLGFTPEQVVSKSAHEFITEGFDSRDYMSLYEINHLNGAGMEGDTSDKPNAYAVEGNLRTAYGRSVYSRLTLFPCDNCVLYLCQMFHDAPLLDRTELEVRALDGEMRRINVTRECGRKRAKALARPGSSGTPVYSTRSRHVKAAFILEHPAAANSENDKTGDRQAGPLVVFVTGSVSHLVDADSSDVMRTPFLKLVAPEDLLHVSKYFDRLADSTDVLFETFALLSRPPVVEGDVEVADHENHRVVVECLGASSQDGLAVLVRKLRTVPAPKRDTMGNYIHSRVHRVDDEGAYVSLAELISSDPETSDAPEAWSHLC
ncbi:hypothetical protein H4R21_000166 [Coemansia helicoidea]|uniref:Uncharacterized protein n=1 Tax=Coemansia helicoidea TaxID=1286919 RepID=A0ACC1LHC3_9FUNG|nr:hypothetical protein H4R21_000166 [Coemansia helicoidea]